MTAAPILDDRREWTVDDLGELPRDLRYELINGRLIVPSPTLPHQTVMGLVWTALRVNCPRDFVVGMDQSLRVDNRSEPRPDVVVVRRERSQRSPIPIDDAILAVEIVSPDSTFRDMFEKAHLYARAGVETYWVIDPIHGDMTLAEMTLTPTGDYEVVAHTAEVFTTDRPWSTVIDLPAWTREWADGEAVGGSQP